MLLVKLSSQLSDDERLECNPPDNLECTDEKNERCSLGLRDRASTIPVFAEHIGRDDEAKPFGVGVVWEVVAQVGLDL